MVIASLAIVIAQISETHVVHLDVQAPTERYESRTYIKNDQIIAQFTSTRQTAKIVSTANGLFEGETWVKPDGVLNLSFFSSALNRFQSTGHANQVDFSPPLRDPSGTAASGQTNLHRALDNDDPRTIDLRELHSGIRSIKIYPDELRALLKGDPIVLPNDLRVLRLKIEKSVPPKSRLASKILEKPLFLYNNGKHPPVLALTRHLSKILGDDRLPSYQEFLDLDLTSVPRLVNRPVGKRIESVPDLDIEFLVQKTFPKLKSETWTLTLRNSRPHSITKSGIGQPTTVLVGGRSPDRSADGFGPAEEADLLLLTAGLKKMDRRPVIGALTGPALIDNNKFRLEGQGLQHWIESAPEWGQSVHISFAQNHHADTSVKKVTLVSARPKIPTNRPNPTNTP